MKSTLLKKTLAALTLGCLGLVATGAQAGESRGEDGYGYGHSALNRHSMQSAHAYRQSQRYSQHINLRQDRQRERIQTGMRTGSLTRAEFRRLMQEQRHIRAMEHRFRADGRINAREFQRLDHALDLASRNIMAEKHDRQERYAARPRARFN
jgi:hypothetical protein